MDKTNCDFDTWCDAIRVNVLDRVGVNFQDVESVRDDYEQGRSCYDVIDEIVAEYEA